MADRMERLEQLFTQLVEGALEEHDDEDLLDICTAARISEERAEFLIHMTHYVIEHLSKGPQLKKMDDLRARASDHLIENGMDDEFAELLVNIAATLVTDQDQAVEELRFYIA